MQWHKVDKYIRDVAFSIVLFYLILVSANLFLFPDQPGFLGMNPHPFLIAILLIAGRFGLWESLIAATIGTVIFIVFLVLDRQPYFQWSMVVEKEYIITILSFYISAVLVGEMRRLGKSYERDLLRENEALRRDRERLKEQLEIVTQLKEELENRIIGQEETVHSLYQAFRALETLEEDKFYQGLTQLTARFTGASRVSLYVVDYPNEKLRRVAAYGYAEPLAEDISAPLYEGIFGLIIKENRLLTIKDITDNPDYLQKWKNCKYQAYAYAPISVASVVVGILTIDDIPFLRLNLSTVRMLSLIAELAVPALKNIIQFQDIQQMLDVDPVTGLPNFESFLELAGVEFKKSVRYGLDFSVVMLEITNLDQIEAEYGHDARVQTLKWLGSTIRDTLRSVDIFGLGEKPGQFAMALPVTDADGSFVLIERLEKVLNQHKKQMPWLKRLDIRLGAASYHPGVQSLDELLEAAKEIISLQQKKKGEPETKPEKIGDGLETIP